ncbi:hypothetical protein Taro_006032, partial [Colocasia esculenta]|nr:hypothetical protein [Colocasia esculenta]
WPADFFPPTPPPPPPKLFSLSVSYSRRNSRSSHPLSISLYPVTLLFSAPFSAPMAARAAHRIRPGPSLLLLLSSLYLLRVDASVHDYAGEKFAAKGNAFILHGGSEGLYASSRPPADPTTSPDAANGDSFIRFEKITFRRPKEAAGSGKEDDVKTVQAIIFEVEDRETIGGSAYGGQRAICCTPDLAKLGACAQGTVIYRPSTLNPKWPQVLDVTFKGNELVAALPSHTIPIMRTGMYNLYFIYCDSSLNGLTIEGKTIWKNPSGYLPGRMSPLMNFYGAMSLAFVILGIFWFSQYARFWREVLPLQNSITLVIALGMFETTMWYFEYAEFNKTGVRPTGITIWAVTFGTVKRTVARVIILVVSMGFGVVRPTLGGLTSKVVMLGTTFFLASEVLELAENVGTVSDLSGKARLFLVLPVAFLDAFFILWIFTSLSKTLDKLQTRRLTAKLEIYRKFTNALGVTVIVSVCWIGYEVILFSLLKCFWGVRLLKDYDMTSETSSCLKKSIIHLGLRFITLHLNSNKILTIFYLFLYCKSTDVYNERWQNAWIIPAFWQVLSFSLLCVICVLWAPSQNSMRYAYSDDGSEEFDRDDTLSLIKPAPLQSKDNWSSSSPDGKTALTIDVTPLEEDKRE